MCPTTTASPPTTTLLKNMNQLPLTKKESQVLDDVLNYMIDYMQDRVWSTQDRLAFDRIYSKNKSLKYWNAGVPSIT